MRCIALAFFCLTSLSCTPATTPRAPIDSEVLEAACDHLAAIGCKEGMLLYDSDNPGPKGVPNTLCTEEYTKRINNGTCVNFKALAQIQSCAAVKAAQQQGCE